MARGVSKRKKHESPRQKAERLAREKRLKQKAAASKSKKAAIKKPKKKVVAKKKPIPKVSAPEYEFPFSVSLMRKFHGPKVSAKYRKSPDEKKLQKEVMERDYAIASRKTPKKKVKPVKYKAAYKEVTKKKPVVKKKAVKKVISAVKPDVKKKAAPKKVAAKKAPVKKAPVKVAKKAPSKKAPAKKKKYLGKYPGIDFIQKARRKKIGIKADEKAGRVRSKAKKAVKTKGGTYVKYEKKSKSAQSFRNAFKEGCSGDAKTFEWDGRVYACKRK